MAVFYSESDDCRADLLDEIDMNLSLSPLPEDEVFLGPSSLNFREESDDSMDSEMVSNKFSSSFVNEMSPTFRTSLEMPVPKPATVKLDAIPDVQMDNSSVLNSPSLLTFRSLKFGLGQDPNSRINRISNDSGYEPSPTSGISFTFDLEEESKRDGARLIETNDETDGDQIPDEIASNSSSIPINIPQNSSGARKKSPRYSGPIKYDDNIEPEPCFSKENLLEQLCGGFQGPSTVPNVSVYPKLSHSRIAKEVSRDKLEVPKSNSTSNTKYSPSIAKRHCFQGLPELTFKDGYSPSRRVEQNNLRRVRSEPDLCTDDPTAFNTSPQLVSPDVIAPPQEFNTPGTKGTATENLKKGAQSPHSRNFSLPATTPDGRPLLFAPPPQKCSKAARASREGLIDLTEEDFDGTAGHKRRVLVLVLPDLLLDVEGQNRLRAPASAGSQLARPVAKMDQSTGTFSHLPQLLTADNQGHIPRSPGNVSIHPPTSFLEGAYHRALPEVPKSRRTSWRRPRALSCDVAVEVEVGQELRRIADEFSMEEQRDGWDRARNPGGIWNTLRNSFRNTARRFSLQALVAPQEQNPPPTTTSSNNQATATEPTYNTRGRRNTFSAPNSNLDTSTFRGRKVEKKTSTAVCRVQTPMGSVRTSVQTPFLAASTFSASAFYNSPVNAAKPLMRLNAPVYLRNPMARASQGTSESANRFVNQETYQNISGTAGICENLIRDSGREFL